VGHFGQSHYDGVILKDLARAAKIHAEMGLRCALIGKLKMTRR
jgi:hypothetical protein